MTADFDNRLRISLPLLHRIKNLGFSLENQQAFRETIHGILEEYITNEQSAPLFEVNCNNKTLQSATRSVNRLKSQRVVFTKSIPHELQSFSKNLAARRKDLSSSLVDLCDDAQQRCPTLFDYLSKCSKRKSIDERRRLMLCVCIMLLANVTNEHCTNFAATLGAVLYSNGVSQQVIELLCRFGICSSYNTITNQVVNYIATRQATFKTKVESGYYIPQLIVDNFERRLDGKFCIADNQKMLLSTITTLGIARETYIKSGDILAMNEDLLDYRFNYNMLAEESNKYHTRKVREFYLNQNEYLNTNHIHTREQYLEYECWPSFLGSGSSNFDKLKFFQFIEEDVVKEGLVVGDQVDVKWDNSEVECFELFVYKLRANSQTLDSLLHLMEVGIDCITFKRNTRFNKGQDQLYLLTRCLPLFATTNARNYFQLTSYQINQLEYLRNNNREFYELICNSRNVCISESSSNSQRYVAADEFIELNHGYIHHSNIEVNPYTFPFNVQKKIYAKALERNAIKGNIENVQHWRIHQGVDFLVQIMNERLGSTYSSVMEKVGGKNCKKVINIFSGNRFTTKVFNIISKDLLYSYDNTCDEMAVKVFEELEKIPTNPFTNDDVDELDEFTRRKQFKTKDNPLEIEQLVTINTYNHKAATGRTIGHFYEKAAGKIKLGKRNRYNGVKASSQDIAYLRYDDSDEDYEPEDDDFILDEE